jgi:micrococcal nuclease
MMAGPARAARLGEGQMRKLLLVLGIGAAVLALSSCLPAGSYVVGNGYGQVGSGPYLFGGTSGACSWSIRQANGTLRRGAYGNNKGPFLVNVLASDTRVQSSCSIARVSGCSRSYRRCIPNPPPDLDCPQVPFRDFSVSGTDPHGFDANHDGIGCESP